MNECRLNDDGGPEVHVVEAGETPQALLIRVGPVFHDKEEEPGVWVTYQDHYMSSSLTGPVLLTPKVWKELNRAVRTRLKKNHKVLKVLRGGKRGHEKQM